MFKPMLKPLAAVALLLVAGASQAALTTYSSQAAFNAATTARGTDTFTDISLVAVTQNNGATRTAGAYTYVPRALLTPTVGAGFGGPFYGAGNTGDPALSLETATNTISFGSFSSGVSAISGLFFPTDFSGLFSAGSLSLVVGDSTGATLTLPITPASAAAGFMGFTSTGTISYLFVTATQPSAGFIWPAVDNLTLAAAVPEVQTYAMMLAGLGALGFVARRRRS